MILICLLNFLYSTIFVIGKFALKISQPIFLTAIRMIGAGIISYGIHRFFHRSPQFRLLTKNDWIVLFVMAFFNVYMTNAGEFWSLQYLSAGKTAFIYNFSPFFALIFSAMLFSEKVTTKKLLGMSIGFIALIPILLGKEDIVDTTYHFFGYISIAEIVMVGAAMATSLGWVIMEHFVKKNKFTTYFLNGSSMFLGGIMCLVHSCLFESRPFITDDRYSNFAFYAIIIMLIQNVGAYNLHTYLLKYYSATWLTLSSFTMPLLTIFISYIVLGEPLTISFFICSALVALGLFIFCLDDLQEKAQ